MNQEEREAFTRQITQRMVVSLQHTTNAAFDAANAEQTIRPMLTRYGIEMYAAGHRNAEEWIRRTLASLPIPEGGKEPVRAYRWKTQDVEGDGVTFAYGLEQALTHLMNQQR